MGKPVYFRNKEEEREFVLKGLLRAYKSARKHKRCKAEVRKFESNLMQNLWELTEEIVDREYMPSPGIAFVREDPVIREIFAAPFRDRVVHHFLVEMNGELFDRDFIETSTSCRKGKGTHYAIKELAKTIRVHSDNYRKETYIARFDIKGFFMSMSREMLFEKVDRMLDKYYVIKDGEYKLCRFLWKVIIFDDPTVGVKRKGGLKKWGIVPKSKSLFRQPRGRGIVIGNLTSQLLSNIFLDDLDKFVTEVLGYKKYGRYVDDFYIVVKKGEFEKFLREVKLIEDFLMGMGLELHPNKRSIQEMRKGVSFLGAVIYPNRVFPGKRLKKRVEEAIRAWAKDKNNDEVMTSYRGHLKHFNSIKIVQKIEERVAMSIACEEALKEEKRCLKEKF